MAQGTWETTSATKLEKNISQTKGAIFYFNRNKSDLFVNMIDELFFFLYLFCWMMRKICCLCVPLLSSTQPIRHHLIELKRIWQVTIVFQMLLRSYSIIIQAQKHYTGFSNVLETTIKNEQNFMSNSQARLII